MVKPLSLKRKHALRGKPPRAQKTLCLNLGDAPENLYIPFADGNADGVLLLLQKKILRRRPKAHR